MNAENAVKDSQKTVQSEPTKVQQQADNPDTNSKMLTQEEVNKIVAERVERERSKFEKKFGNIDPDHYKQLVEEAEQKRQAELQKRGEFEKLLKEQAEKFSNKIQQYESELTTIKVDGTLLSAASENKAINPQQVVRLLKDQIKLNEAGAVDVLDSQGKVRYDDKGNPIPVSQLVREFLDANPHFKAAGPQGSGTGNAVGKQASVVETDITKLNMNNPADREQYKKILQGKGVRI